VFGPAVEVGIVGEPGEYPNIAAVVVDFPAVFDTGMSLKCTVKSADGLPLKITAVKTLTIEPKH
jgi:hypothetical protein